MSNLSNMTEGSEDPHINEELFTLYKGIKNDIPNDILPTNRTKNIDSITLISYIKESIPLLINHKVSEAISNNNSYSVELELNNKSKKFVDLKKQYLQLESQLKKLEKDNKYYLSKCFKYKIQKDIVDMKLNAYITLEEEYEQLKEKVKYQGGKFLENDRKDNEIIILRSENSALKKEINKFGIIIQNHENKNKEYEEKIQCLQNNIENLNKKIQDLEKIIHNNKIKSSENSLEKYDNISHRIITSKNYGNIKNIKAIYPQSISFKNKKVIGYHSPKNEIYNKSSSTINAHFLCNSNYNRMKNLTNNKKMKYHLKNDLTTLQKLKNDSITIIKIEKDEKSFSANKNINNNLERNRCEKYLYKTGNKIKTFNKILPPNPQYYSPLSCKSTYNYDTIVPKYIEKEMRKNILNNYAQNIINKSNKH